MNEKQKDCSRLRWPSLLIGGFVVALCSACGGGAGGGSALPSSLNGAKLDASQTNAQSFGTYSSVIALDKPLAYFRLDNASGTVAIDSGSKPMNGTYSGALNLGATSLLAVDADPAVNFSGGYVKMSNDVAVQPTTAISVEAWIEPSSAATNAQVAKIVSNSQAWSAPYDAYLLSLQAGQPTFRIIIGGQAVQISAPNALAAGTIHHLVGTYDGSAVRIWVDGRLGGSIPASGAITNYSTNGWAIGSDVAGGWVFRGTIDEVAIYPQALSLNRILMHEGAAGSGAVYASSVLAANPVGYYRLGETTGSVAYDASATNMNGSYSSGVSQGAVGVFGGLDLSANILTGIVSIPRAVAQFPSAALTVEAIARPSASALSAQEVKLVSAGTPWLAPYDSYKLTLENGHPAMAIATNVGTYQVIAATTVTAGGLYALTGTYDGGALSIYLNGQLLKTMQASGSLYASTGTGLALGGDVTSNWLYHGELDDVAIYPTALGAGLIGRHAALIPGLTAIVAAPSPSPVVPTAPPTPVPTPTPLPGIQLSSSSVAILSMGSSATVTASELGYNGNFAVVSSTCAGIATIQSQGAVVSVVPQAAGICHAIIGATNGQTTTLAVSVTLTSMSGV